MSYWLLVVSLRLAVHLDVPIRVSLVSTGFEVGGHHFPPLFHRRCTQPPGLCKYDKRTLVSNSISREQLTLQLVLFIRFVLWVSTSINPSIEIFSCPRIYVYLKSVFNLVRWVVEDVNPTSPKLSLHPSQTRSVDVFTAVTHSSPPFRRLNGKVSLIRTFGFMDLFTGSYLSFLFVVGVLTVKLNET